MAVKLNNRLLIKEPNGKKSQSCTKKIQTEASKTSPEILCISIFLHIPHAQAQTNTFWKIPSLNNTGASYNIYVQEEE